ncbi:hypothetical protein N018_12445 [Pseudomonas syringae CC1557]|uniref:Uncharacterized protein n=1 Tax=Pseudomonas syringae CC1557 TaxID=1357279 RepID=W0N2S1_PSESX|nr:hypothetical protein N018_12445 [Pseudomonas syringae CC1557]
MAEYSDQHWVAKWILEYLEIVFGTSVANRCIDY